MPVTGIIGPWCLHKHDGYIEVTCISDPIRVYLCFQCNGIRIELYE